MGQVEDTVTMTTFLCLLATAQNWEQNVDLGNQMKFLETVATTIRPDMVLIFETCKQMVHLQMTISWQHSTQAANKRKKAKDDSEKFRSHEWQGGECLYIEGMPPSKTHET